MINRKGKHYKNRKETNEDIANRILKLAEPGEYGIFPPPMKAQVAVDELCRFFLGDDYWTIVNSNEQANTEIVYEIETKYKKVNRK
jgi:hypothetical protein